MSASPASARSVGTEQTNGTALSVEEEFELPTVYEPTSREHLKEHMIKHACAVEDPPGSGNWKFPVVRKTGPRGIGSLTKSVGIQLYFELLSGLGWTFFVMFLLSIPLLVCNCSGRMIESTNALNKALAMTTVANIGRCPAEGCESMDDFEYRCMWSGECDDTKPENLVRSWTPYLGGLDALCLLTFMLFGVVFRNLRIPYVVKQFDMSVVTPADFALDIPNPPRCLGKAAGSAEHLQYEDKLRKHFVKVLQNLAEGPYPDANDSFIPEISLVREYNGATSKFLEKGQHIENLRSAHVAKLKLNHPEYGEKNEEKRAKRVAKHEKAMEKSKHTIDKLSKRLKAEAEIIEKERAVCRAFVTFKSIEVKEKVEWEYRFSQYVMLRCCQGEKLRFEGRRIKVQQAPEPSDLYWENLDFNRKQQYCRKFLILIVTILVLIATAFGLVAAKSFFGSEAKPREAYDTWVLQSWPEKTGSGSHVRNNTCFAVQGWELREKCSTLGANSGGWHHDFIWDATGLIHNNSNRALPANRKNGNDFWQDVDWRSPACNESNPATNLTEDSQWIAMQYSKNHSVKCINLMMDDKDYASRVRIWACDSKQIPKPSARSSWSPSQGCHPMQVITTKKGQNKLLKVIVDTSCPGTITLAAAQQAKSMNDEQTVNCFCQQEVVRDPQVSTNFETPEGKVCQEWSLRQVRMYGAMIFSVIAVLIINQILLFIFTFFVSFMRPMTITEKTVSELVMLFFSQFINTALLIYLVNCRMPSIPDGIKFVTEPLSIGKGEYYEVTGDWYLVIGASLIITVMTQVFTNTLPQIATSGLVAPLIRKFTMWCGGVVSKRQLEAVWMLPEWNLALRTAQNFNVLCTIMFYCGGMPILYLAGAFYAFIGYWMDKFGLLHGSRRPPSFNSAVIETCMNFIPMSAVLHALFACFIFGNQDLFPSDFNEWLQPLAEAAFDVTAEEARAAVEEWSVASASERDNTEVFSAFMQARWLDFSRWGTVALMVIFIVGFVYYILMYLWLILLAPILQPLLSALRECFRKNCCPWLCGHKKEELERAADWREVQKELQDAGHVHSYFMKDNPDYRDAADAVDHTARQELERRGTGASLPGNSPIRTSKGKTGDASPSSSPPAVTPSQPDVHPEAHVAEGGHIEAVV